MAEVWLDWTGIWGSANTQAFVQLVANEPNVIMLEWTGLNGQAQTAAFIQVDHVTQHIEITATAEAHATVTVVKHINSAIANGRATTSGRIVRMRVVQDVTPMTGSAATAGKILRFRQVRSVRIDGKADISLGQIAKYTIIKPPAIEATAEAEAYYWDRNIKQDMNDYLPKYYDLSAIKDALIQAEASEFVRLNVLTYKVLDQLFPDTATWGLYRWERICGIVTDETLPIEQRREQVLQRIRGHKTITPAYVREQVAQWVDSTITEFPRESMIEIKLHTRGDASSYPHYNEMLVFLRELLPAHIDFRIIFNQVTWGELEDNHVTYGDIEGMTYREFAAKIWG